MEQKMQNLSLFESNSQPFTVNNHLSFKFNNHTNPKLTRILSLTEMKSYTPITGCVLEHIITTTNLTNCEKLFYLLGDSLSLVNKNKGKSRSCALPSEDWAERLGCSRSLVFTMQRSLVKKGYFIINKDFDEIGRNKRNLITPTLPASVFNHLNEKSPDRVGDHNPYNYFVECKRSYLDRTKLFIKLNYDILKLISSNEYTNPRQKILWLGFYTRCYKTFMLQNREGGEGSKYSYNGDSSFSFISSYRELADMYSCNTKHLSKSIRALEKLGFIKAQNIYIRKRCSDNSDNRLQERQNRSLWKITLSLPESCILELEKVKNRSNLKLKNIKDGLAAIENTLDPKLIEDCLILGGIKFNLNLEQSTLLKSLIESGINDNGLEGTNVNSNGILDIIPPMPHAPCAELHTQSYIDSVMEELDASDAQNIVGVESKSEESTELEYIDFSSDNSKTLLTSSSIESSHTEVFANVDKKSDGIKSDPHVAKSGLLLNKDFLLKIKDIKSNLGATPKVLFNNFLKRFSKDESDENVDSKKDDIAKDREFNIHSELIREKLKILPKDKADKARKFAYSLVSKGLAKGYAASLSKHELAKQIIHHAATWKPTKLGCVSREKEIDAALSVAWKKIISGTWQVPLELAKAKILQYEFNAYRRKYQESGVLSHEAKALESDVNNLLGGWCDLVGKITDGVNTPATLEDNMLSIRDVDVYSSINVPLELGLEERVCQQSPYPSEGLALDNSFVFDLASDQGGHQFDYDYPEIEERSNCLNISLSHIPEQQKYLKVIPSDTDDSIKLETINGKEYFVKLKELEMNKDGEFVMTLSSSSGGSFENRVTALSGYDNLLLSDKKLSFDNTDEQATQLSRKEFTRIDGALANIFNNLIIKV
jgi:DNA-binding Lrp family transcriptional regulator